MSEIVPKARPAAKTILERPALTEATEARATMRECFENGDPAAALYWCELLIEFRPDDLEAREYALRCRVELENFYADLLGGWTRVPYALFASGGIVERFGLDDEELLLLETLDGQLTLQEVAECGLLPPLEALKVLFGLVHGGLVVMT